MNDDHYSISPSVSRDPAHWASLEAYPAIADAPENDPELLMEIRITMTTVALLHRDFPDRRSFTNEEVEDYLAQTLEEFPELKGLQ